MSKKTYLALAPRLLLMVLFALLVPAVAFGQAAKVEKDDVAEPEDITVLTKDFMLLKCTYFAGPKSKKTVPMILLHDWEGDREDVEVMARLMQEEYGRSVIIPDLRGHGKSTERRGLEKKVDYEDFKKKDIASIQLDIEACKKYLVQRNNSGELNINMLIVGAVGSMNVHAMEWTLTDWSYGPPIAGIKQGQDVQGLLMIGPKRKLSSFSLSQHLKSPLISGKGAYTLPIMMVYGSQNTSEAKEAKAIYATLKKSRPEEATNPEKYWDGDLFKKVYKTRAAAVKMIGTTDKGTKDIAKNFSEFIENKVEANAEDFRWGSRAKKK